jgi:hypothetical protein
MLCERLLQAHNLSIARDLSASSLLLQKEPKYDMSGQENMRPADNRVV